jgi:hypothetical protein
MGRETREGEGERERERLTLTYDKGKTILDPGRKKAEIPGFTLLYKLAKGARRESGVVVPAVTSGEKPGMPTSWACLPVSCQGPATLPSTTHPLTWARLPQELLGLGSKAALSPACPYSLEAAPFPQPALSANETLFHRTFMQRIVLNPH